MVLHLIFILEIELEVCQELFWSHFNLGTNSHSYLAINYNFSSINSLFCCLLIVSKVVVKFRSG